jgi:hypothetical protein
MPSRNEFEVRWPNLLRVDTVVKPALSVQWSKVPDLMLDPAQTVITAELAPAVSSARVAQLVQEGLAGNRSIVIARARRSGQTANVEETITSLGL